ncbi:Polyadenylate-binding protein RBP45 [Vitis vinifera]|uniref:Polyadenylate-binding protein RBP45 n=1 Tax=Vitis vinifera TaxID=29760 RepID=A0A438DXT8_VITVI|nr:Polyadenylate-binding protein RBP45 [Vitis vinifera]
MELGCKLGKIPSFYLGLPPRASCKSEAVWDKVEEKFRRRLLMWKRQYISKGRTLALIRSTLLSLSIYFISLFVIHRKWSWRYASKGEVLWKQIIEGKYGKGAGWHTCEASGGYGVGVWKALRGEIFSLVRPCLKWEAWVADLWEDLGGGGGGETLVTAIHKASSFQNTQGNQGESDPNNTTIFVGGLDSNVTDDYLRQVFSQYGELVHVKIPVGKRCGFVQFANRACAEQALAGLNGTQLGAQSIRLSWGRSPSNKQAQPDQAQWNGGYYGYAQGYEAYGYAPPPQDPNMYYGAYPGYGNYQQPQQLAEGVLTTCGTCDAFIKPWKSFYAYKARIPSTLSFCLVG